MTAVLRAEEPSARYLVEVEPTLTRGFELLASAQGGVPRIRGLLLSLAAQGKLVPQDASDEPADVLLARIHTEKSSPGASDRIKRAKYSRAMSNADEPFEIPSSWVWARLGEITTFGECDKASDIADTTWVLDLEDIEKDTGRIARRVTFAERRSLSDKNVFRAQDVLYGKLRPYLNKVAVADADGVCTTEILPFRGYGGIDPHYLRTAIQSPYFLAYVNAKSYGMKMPRLGTDDGRNAWIPLAPLAEQHRIFARVEELMKLCNALEQSGRLADEQHARLTSALFDALAASESAHALAENWQRVAEHFDFLLDRPEAIDALEQTIFQLTVRGLLVAQDSSDEHAGSLRQRIHGERTRLFASGTAKREKALKPVGEDEHAFPLPSNWVWVRFDELVRADKPIAYGVLVPGPDTPEGIPFVRLADLSLERPAAQPEKSIAANVDAQFARTRLEGGEILLGVVGSIGKLGVAPDTWKGANIARAICRIVPTSLVDRSYVLNLLQSEFMKARFSDDTRTLAQPTLNVGLIRECPTPLPPLAEQRRIVARVEELRRLCAQLRERLTDARRTQSQLADALVAEVAA